MPPITPTVWPPTSPPILSWSPTSSSSSSSSSSSERSPRQNRTSFHPYARLEAKKKERAYGVKRRKVWDHLLEKRIFTTDELMKIKAQDRRKIYIASLEAHVDNLHSQMLSQSLYPVPFERLENMSGLHSKTATAMISAVLYDTQEMRLKLLEVERGSRNLQLRLKDKTSVGYYSPPDVVTSTMRN